MLAMDYLGLDPDRDNIRFLVLGDQPSRIQALEAGRAQASWMGSTFSALLKKKGYTVLFEMARAPIVGRVAGRAKERTARGAEDLRIDVKRHNRRDALLYETGK